jgi:hypothetical protein
LSYINQHSRTGETLLRTLSRVERQRFLTGMNFINLLGTMVVYMVSQVFLGLHLSSFFFIVSTYTGAVFPLELHPDWLVMARHSLEHRPVL